MSDEMFIFSSSFSLELFQKKIQIGREWGVKDMEFPKVLKKQNVEKLQWSIKIQKSENSRAVQEKKSCGTSFTGLGFWAWSFQVFNTISQLRRFVLSKLSRGSYSYKLKISFFGFLFNLSPFFHLLYQKSQIHVRFPLV